MSTKSENSPVRPAEDTIGVFSALEDRLNNAVDDYAKLDNGYVRLSATKACDTEWQAMLQCYEKTYHGEDTSKNRTAEKDKNFSYERVMKHCADLNDSFLECAQKERVHFMKRLARQVDMAEARPNLDGADK